MENNKDTQKTHISPFADITAILFYVNSQAKNNGDEMQQQKIKADENEAKDCRGTRVIMSTPPMKCHLVTFLSNPYP